MKKAAKPLTTDEIGILIGLASVVVGAGLYLYPPALAGFPVNDGGLFYTMVRAIQQNGMRLPAYVQYNGLSIPFAYPPLGFYLGALISGVFGIDPLRVIQWFPAVVLIGVSIAIYFLAATVLKSRIEAGLAAFFYVCTPRSMTWLVMGGGLTRSLGQLLLILTAMSVWSLFTEHRRRHLSLSIAFGALLVLTHPEAALHAVAVCALFWVFKGRSRRGVIEALMTASGVLLVTAIWWLPILQKFGIGPFASAAQTGLHASILFIYPFLLTFGEEPEVTIIAALALIGAVASLAKRAYLLPVWLLLPFAIEPRGAPTAATIPLALLSAVAVYEVLLPGITAIDRRLQGEGTGSIASNRTALFAGLYLALFLLIMGVYAGMQLSQVKVSAADQAAIQWVASNTPPQSRFLILTGDTELFCDPVQEWFPVLAQRLSETTIQGNEWGSNGTFFTRVAQLQDMQRCLSADGALECVQEAAARMGIQYQYIYLSRQITTKQMCRATGDARVGAALSMELTQDAAYQAVYRTADVEIYSARP